MKKEFDDHQDDSEGKSGSGDVSGKIHYRYKDAASLGPRDDALPPAEIKRLLIVHVDLHKERVKKQKQTREDRKALKEGKVHLTSNYRQGLGGSGGGSRYKKHPISAKAQFAGENKVNPINLDADTNLEMREKLENRNVHRNVPRFNPKPRPR